MAQRMHYACNIASILISILAVSQQSDLSDCCAYEEIQDTTHGDAKATIILGVHTVIECGGMDNLHNLYILLSVWITSIVDSALNVQGK